MTTSIDHDLHQQRWRIPYWLGACVFLVVAGFFLWVEHRAHLLGAIPYVLLLLCPVVHLFMHRGRGGHSGHHQHESTSSRMDERRTP
jgi:uncharacterized membrane protein YkvI